MQMASPEIWKLVPSVPGVLASSYGRVMILPTLGHMPNGGVRSYGARARNGQWDGERFIAIVERKTYRVARLICEAFNGPPPPGTNVCMHLDENSRNNMPINLRWGTQKENLNAPGFLNYCRTRTGENNPRIKGIARREAV